jgi:hypothetical protein
MRRALVVTAWLLNFIFAPGPPAAAQDVRLDVARDTWVSEVGSEADGNNGGASRLKLKSMQEMSLIDVDPAPLRGHVVKSATLHVKLAGDEPLRRVTVGGIGAPWFEGKGTGYAREPGGATFRHRRYPDLHWSVSGGDLCHVILGNGGTNWGMADATRPDSNSEGWQSIAISPAVVAARMAGLSQGFLVFDDTGSEWTRQGQRFTFRLFPNRFVFSRNQNKASAPYMNVVLGAEDRLPPAAPGDITVETRNLPVGEAIISWVTPRDAGPAGTLGFFATLDGRSLPGELVPLAAAPGIRVTMHLRDLGLPRPGAGPFRLSVKAVDGAGNIGPEAEASIRLSTREPEALPGRAREIARALIAMPLPRLGTAEVAVIDELDKVHPVTGAFIPPQPEGYLHRNHLWKAEEPGRGITLHAARNEFTAFQILIRGQARGQPRFDLVFEELAAKAIQTSFARYHLVETPAGALPDPIVPLDLAGPSLPPVSRSTPSQIGRQSFHVELYVPQSAPAGTHRGTLTVTMSAGADRLRLPVSLTVWDFTLPDHLSFLPEMNCYGLPDDELAYYLLAHRHRTVLNRLPYNQNGRIQDGCAPRWDEKAQRLDFTAWDRRFGPLLDGSAFVNQPRRGVPVECFYLPLHENWPSPMERNYKGGYWADQAFPESYRRAFVSASRQMAEHFRDRGWTDTLFHGFLNNKVDFKKNGWSRGSSVWLLDEPASFQDFWALRYFALAFHEGVNEARKKSGDGDRDRFPRMVFRADISRPQWRRDVLDGVLDYHVVGSAMRQYPRLVFDRKRAFGEIVVEYGGTNPVTASNLQPVSWSLDAWTLGADGVLPWQTVGRADSWRKADELALFYPLPATKAGVLPSVRLKAYRRGQQDVEYLTLWARQRSLPRWAVGQQVRATLPLAGSRQATESGGAGAGAEDAGRIDNARLRPQDFWALRTRIGEALSQAHPRPLSRLVEFRTPPRDLTARGPVPVLTNEWIRFREN